MEVAQLRRVFLYNGVKLPDPGVDLSAEQALQMFVPTYPELATAAVEGPAPVNGELQFTFTREVGSKG